MKIIMYHYVRDFNLSRNKGLKGLDINEFKSQIKYLNMLLGESLLLVVIFQNWKILL